MDAERDGAEVDLEDNQHAGIFTGAKRFAKTQVHCCDLCGFRAHTPTYFCVVNCCGIPANKTQPSTNDYLVSQLSEKFEFLKKLPNNELNRLKKELYQIIGEEDLHEKSEMCAKVTETLKVFQQQANQGSFTREYQPAQEVVKICAGCAGLIHGKKYWEQVEHKNLSGEVVKGFRVTSEWRNQFQMTPLFTSVETSNRQLKRAMT